MRLYFEGRECSFRELPAEPKLSALKRLCGNNIPGVIFVSKNFWEELSQFQWENKPYKLGYEVYILPENAEVIFGGIRNRSWKIQDSMIVRQKSSRANVLKAFAHDKFAIIPWGIGGAHPMGWSVFGRLVVHINSFRLPELIAKFMVENKINFAGIGQWDSWNYGISWIENGCVEEVWLKENGKIDKRIKIRPAIQPQHVYYYKDNLIIASSSGFEWLGRDRKLLWREYRPDFAGVYPGRDQLLVVGNIGQGGYLYPQKPALVKQWEVVEMNRNVKEHLPIPNIRVDGERWSLGKRWAEGVAKAIPGGVVVSCGPSVTLYVPIAKYDMVYALPIPEKWNEIEEVVLVDRAIGVRVGEEVRVFGLNKKSKDTNYKIEMDECEEVNNDIKVEVEEYRHWWLELDDEVVSSNHGRVRDETTCNFMKKIEIDDNPSKEKKVEPMPKLNENTAAELQRILNDKSMWAGVPIPKIESGHKTATYKNKIVLAPDADVDELHHELRHWILGHVFHPLLKGVEVGNGMKRLISQYPEVVDDIHTIKDLWVEYGQLFCPKFPNIQWGESWGSWIEIIGASRPESLNPVKIIAVALAAWHGKNLQLPGVPHKVKEFFWRVPKHQLQFVELEERAYKNLQAEDVLPSMQTVIPAGWKLCFNNGILDAIDEYEEKERENYPKELSPEELGSKLELDPEPHKSSGGSPDHWIMFSKIEFD